jgi:hypothetical protein
MNEYREFAPTSFRTWRFDVVPMTPIRDPFKLCGANVVAGSETDAWQYLYDYGGWKPPTTLPTLRNQYRMVARPNSSQRFDGTKWEWIQAVRLGYLPSPVRLAEDTKTQWKIDRAAAVRKARYNQRVREVTKPNLWDQFSYWLEQQKYHPVRWKVVGFLCLGILVVIFWQIILAVVIGILALVVLLNMVG